MSDKTRQIKLEESVEGVQKLKLPANIDTRSEIRPDTVIACGNCGSVMKRMGPTNLHRQDYAGVKYKKGEWQHSCRACMKCSAKVRLNPIPPMVEIEEEFFSDSTNAEVSSGNIIDIEQAAGKQFGFTLLSLGEAEFQNGYPVDPELFDEELHEEIDERTDFNTEQARIFDF